MEDNNPTRTSIILENATNMSEMNDSIAMITNNNPSGPLVPDFMMTTPSSSNPFAHPHDLDSTFSHISRETVLPDPCTEFYIHKCIRTARHWTTAFLLMWNN